MKTFLVLVAMSSMLVASQCSNTQPKPGPDPPVPPPTVYADAAPPPTPSSDKCAQVLDMVRMEGCTLPNEWLDACRTARAHGATFHLGCYAGATSCDVVAACMNDSG